MSFEAWLLEQERLQVEAFGLDPGTLSGDELAEYVTWNVVALNDEVHELLQEIQWKPWAENRGTVLDHDRATGEIVDMLHFVGNLALAFNVDKSKLYERYLRKVETNRKRQHDGYDPLNSGKCPHCHRDLEEAGTHVATWESFEDLIVETLLCSACEGIIERQNIIREEHTE